MSESPTTAAKLRRLPRLSALPFTKRGIKSENGGEPEQNMRGLRARLRARKQRERRELPLGLDIAFLGAKIALIAAFIGIAFAFIFGAMRVSDMGMQPRMDGNDILFYYRMERLWHQGDVVIVEYDGRTYARRIIAQEGDTVDIDDQGLILNGAHQVEERAVGETKRAEGGIEYPVTIPEGCVFLLGDNREESVDSRMYGPVPTRELKGSLFAQIRRTEF